MPPEHRSLFFRELARDVLDLSAIEAKYRNDPRGSPPYHPAMLLALQLSALAQAA